MAILASLTDKVTFRRCSTCLKEIRTITIWELGIRRIVVAGMPRAVRLARPVAPRDPPRIGRARRMRVHIAPPDDLRLLRAATSGGSRVRATLRVAVPIKTPPGLRVGAFPPSMRAGQAQGAPSRIPKASRSRGGRKVGHSTCPASVFRRASPTLGSPPRANLMASVFRRVVPGNMPRAQARILHSPADLITSEMTSSGPSPDVRMAAKSTVLRRSVVPIAGEISPSPLRAWWLCSLPRWARADTCSCSLPRA